MPETSNSVEDEIGQAIRWINSMPSQERLAQAVALIVVNNPQGAREEDIRGAMMFFVNEITAPITLLSMASRELIQFNGMKNGEPVFAITDKGSEEAKRHIKPIK